MEPRKAQPGEPLPIVTVAITRGGADFLQVGGGRGLDENDKAAFLEGIRRYLEDMSAAKVRPLRRQVFIPATDVPESKCEWWNYEMLSMGAMQGGKPTQFSFTRMGLWEGDLPEGACHVVSPAEEEDEPVESSDSVEQVAVPAEELEPSPPPWRRGHGGLRGGESQEEPEESEDEIEEREEDEEEDEEETEEID